MKICKDTIKAIHIEYCRKVLLLKRNEHLQKLKFYLLGTELSTLEEDRPPSVVTYNNIPSNGQSRSEKKAGHHKKVRTQGCLKGSKTLFEILFKISPK